MSVQESGHYDLFVAYAIFLVPSVIASLLTMGLKMQLIIRRFAKRREKLAVVQQHCSLGRAKRDFFWLAERLILLRDQRRYEERKNANNIALHEAYAYMLLAATEDAPFCVLNFFLLSRAFRDRFDPRFLGKQRLCSPQYETNFDLILVILLTSVAALVYKVMHLVEFPRLWATQKRLMIEKARLDERSKVLNGSLDLGSPANALTASDPTMMTVQQVLPSRSKASCRVARCAIVSWFLGLRLSLQFAGARMFPACCRRKPVLSQWFRRRTTHQANHLHRR